MRNERQKQRGLSAALCLGLVSQVAQVLLLRESLMLFQGNELSIGLVLAAWMAWVGIGSACASRWRRRIVTAEHLLLANAIWVWAVLPASILLIRWAPRWIVTVPGSSLTPPEMALASLVITAPACFALGVQFVLSARIGTVDGAAQGTGGGAERSYAAEAAGNAIGGVLVTTVLARQWNAVAIAFAAGGLLALGAAACGRPRPAGAGQGWRWERSALAAGLALLALLLLPPALHRLNRWSHRLQWAGLVPRYELVRVVPSKHGSIAVLQQDATFSYYQSGHLLFTTAGPATKRPELEEQDAAVLAHLALCQHPEPRRVLWIGGGLRGVVREALRHPLERLDYVELDAALLEAARPLLHPSTAAALEDPRVRLLHTDGRLFVKGAAERYDLIVVDVPDPATAALNRFYTVEFFREARSRLAPGGVLALTADSTAERHSRPGAHRNSTLFHSLAAVFARVLPLGEQPLLLVATDAADRLAADSETLAERYLQRGIRSPAFAATHFRQHVRPLPMRRVFWSLSQHGRSAADPLGAAAQPPLMPPSIEAQQQALPELAPVQAARFLNTDMKPLAMYYTQWWRNEQTRAGRAVGWFATAPGLDLRRLLPVALAAPLLALVWPRRRPLSPTAGRVLPRGAVWLAAVTTGFSTMSLQVALLFAFQSVYGFVYEAIGAIIALFMAGLALGAGVSHRLCGGRPRPWRLALLQAVLALYAAALAVGLPATTGLRQPHLALWLFGALTLLSGVMNGVDYPLTTACLAATSGRGERAGGWLYGLELLGACLGAAISSVWIAPLWGIDACGWFSAVANAVACATLVLALARSRLAGGGAPNAQDDTGSMPER